MTTLWTYEAVHPEAYSQGRATARPGWGPSVQTLGKARSLCEALSPVASLLSLPSLLFTASLPGSGCVYTHAHTHMHTHARAMCWPRRR